MNSTLKTLVIAAFTFTLTACGAGSGGAGGSYETRTISGALTGDLSMVRGVDVVNTETGELYETRISAARYAALTGSTANFTSTVPTPSTIQINITGQNGETLATLQSPSNIAGTATTNQFVVTASGNGASGPPVPVDPVPVDPAATGEPVDLGTVTIPPGTGAPGSPALAITSQNNPLAQNDYDGDGVDDLHDDDDSLYEDDDDHSDHNQTNTGANGGTTGGTGTGGTGANTGGGAATPAIPAGGFDDDDHDDHDDHGDDDDDDDDDHFSNTGGTTGATGGTTGTTGGTTGATGGTTGV